MPAAILCNLYDIAHFEMMEYQNFSLSTVLTCIHLNVLDTKTTDIGLNLEQLLYHSLEWWYQKCTVWKMHPRLHMTRHTTYRANFVSAYVQS